MAKDKNDNNPFAALEALRAALPPAPLTLSERSESKGPSAKKPKPPKAAPTRAVVRIERKGRAGKEATIVEKLNLSDAELETWLREMKTAFGCGGSVEDGALVLHGDQRERVIAHLEKLGVAKVIRG